MAAYSERKRLLTRAYCRALARLARRFPAEFTALYEQELEAAGLLPRRPPGPRRRVQAAS